MTRRLVPALLALLAWATALRAAPPLAYQLHAERQHRLAALEFRRDALTTRDPLAAGHSHWFAAYNYLLNRDFSLVERQLDQAEERAPLELELPATWLRAKLAYARGEWPDASFYFGSLADASTTNQLWRSYALRHQTVATLRQGRPAEAERLATGLTDSERAALSGYLASPVKRPWLGGLLGMVPGMGYAYSGEYGNGTRSLLLNSLFIWGMVETARDDHWALFSVLTFFELTWYSGSIYGGIDSAHRYNERALATVSETIIGDLEPRPKPPVFPLLKLGFTW